MPVVPPASPPRRPVVPFALFLVLGGHVGVWAVQLGSLTVALRLDPGDLGVALSAAAAGGVLTLILGGRVADRFGRRAVLVGGFAVAGLAFAALGLARTFPEVVAAVVLYGASISFVDLGANAVGSDYEHANRVEAMTGLQAGFSLGAAVGALGSGGLLAAGTDYRAVYGSLAALFLLTAAWAARAALPARSRASRTGSRTPPAGGSVARNPGVRFAAAVVLVTFFGDGALEGFSAVLVRQALAGGVLLSALGIAGFHLASFTGRALASGALRRVPTRAVITSSGVLAAVGVAIAVVAPAAWISVGGLLLVGFALSPVIPGALSLAGRSAPDRAGQAVAFTTAVGYSSFLVGPLVVGGVAAATDLRVGLGLVVVSALVVAALGTRWPRLPSEHDG